VASPKKKLLIATADSALRSSLTESIEGIFTDAHLVPAHDGGEATLKILNDPPHVILIDPAIPKLPGIQLIEWLLDEKPEAKIAIILLSTIPQKEQFVDEVAKGQIQFLENYNDSVKFKETLARAIEYSHPKQKSDLKVVKIIKDQILINEGDKAESVYLVRAGRLIALTNQGSAVKELGYIEPGEFVGEMAYINGEPRSATVKAIDNCELIEIPVHLLDHVLFTKPAWAKALMKTLSKRVKASNLK
jgi:CRP/FNR family transcriptional regulator, cyclic AMP receptor protein